MSIETPRPHFLRRLSPSAAKVLASFRAGEKSDLRLLDDVTRESPRFRSLILRAANASTHGLTHAISTPEHALAILGASRVRELVEQLIAQDEQLRSTAKAMAAQTTRSEAATRSEAEESRTRDAANHD